MPSSTADPPRALSFRSKTAQWRALLAPLGLGRALLRLCRLALAFFLKLDLGNVAQPLDHPGIHAALGYATGTGGRNR